MSYTFYTNFLLSMLGKAMSFSYVFSADHLASARWSTGAICLMSLSSSHERSWDRQVCTRLKSGEVCRKAFTGTSGPSMLHSSDTGLSLSIRSLATEVPRNDAEVILRSFKIALRRPRKEVSLRSCASCLFVILAGNVSESQIHSYPPDLELLLIQCML